VKKRESQIGDDTQRHLTRNFVLLFSNLVGQGKRREHICICWRCQAKKRWTFFQDEFILLS